MHYIKEAVEESDWFLYDIYINYSGTGDVL